MAIAYCSLFGIVSTTKLNGFCLTYYCTRQIDAFVTVSSAFVQSISYLWRPAANVNLDRKKNFQLSRLDPSNRLENANYLTNYLITWQFITSQRATNSCFFQFLCWALNINFVIWHFLSGCLCLLLLALMASYHSTARAVVCFQLVCIEG